MAAITWYQIDRNTHHGFTNGVQFAVINYRGGVRPSPEDYHVTYMVAGTPHTERTGSVAEAKAKAQSGVYAFEQRVKNAELRERIRKMANGPCEGEPVTMVRYAVWHGGNVVPLSPTGIEGDWDLSDPEQLKAVTAELQSRHDHGWKVVDVSNAY